jgi:hypothetical protein
METSKGVTLDAIPGVGGHASQGPTNNVVLFLTPLFGGP